MAAPAEDRLPESVGVLSKLSFAIFARRRIYELINLIWRSSELADYITSEYKKYIGKEDFSKFTERRMYQLINNISGSQELKDYVTSEYEKHTSETKEASKCVGDDLTLQKTENSKGSISSVFLSNMIKNFAERFPEEHKYYDISASITTKMQKQSAKLYPE